MSNFLFLKASGYSCQIWKKWEIYTLVNVLIIIPFKHWKRSNFVQMYVTEVDPAGRYK